MFKTLSGTLGPALQICAKPFEDPHLLGCCGETACRACIDRAACGFCMKPVDTCPPNLVRLGRPTGGSSRESRSARNTQRKTTEKCGGERQA